MGGIVARIGQTPDGAGLTAAMRTLRHHPSFILQTLVDVPPLSLGAVCRPNDPARAAWLPERRLGVVVYGFAVLTTPHPHRAGAAELAALVADQGVEALFELDGGFLVAVLDLRASKLHVINDRTATIPLQYSVGEKCTVLAPEAKAIAALVGRRPDWDVVGTLSFLNSGYALGTRTLFEGVRLQAPAEALSVALDTGQFERHTYWRLAFRPAAKLALTDAADHLFEVMDACHRLATVDQAPDLQLLLTGGYDSRTVLGVLATLGRPPAECLTWGVSADIPRSDPALAHALAAAHGVPWRFLPYHGGMFASNAQAWAEVSELASDNLGNFAAGAGFLYECGVVGSGVVIGDQLFGTGGMPVTQVEAIAGAGGSFCAGISGGLASVVRADQRAEVDALLRKEVSRLVETCSASSMKDVQDCLGFHVRLARWLNAPTYFREPMVSPRRPMLMRPALEYVQHLPPRLRVDKCVLVEMLHRRMPALLRIPRMRADSLVDWTSTFTGDPAVSPLFEALLRDERRRVTPVWRRLDGTRVDAQLGSYLGTGAMTKTSPGGRPGILPAVRRFSARMPGLAPAVALFEAAARASGTAPVGAKTARVLQRLALLGLLWESQVGAGWTPLGPGDAREPGDWPIPAIAGGSRE